MKIVFMGTPEFAVPCLQVLLDDGQEVCAVFTQSDKPKGRGMKMIAPPVKQLAQQYDIPIYQPERMREPQVEETLRQLNPDLIVVVAYGKILPKQILEIPRLGCVNVHASLLPKYRGAGPIQWSVLNGESQTGITTMFMAEGLDTGDMILKKSTIIGENETSGELHDRLSVLGAECLRETIALFAADAVVREAQNDADSTYAPMLSKSMSHISFDQAAQKVHNLIRGLSPWPTAQISYEGKQLKLHVSRVCTDYPSGEYQCGEVIPVAEQGRLVIACAEGAVEILQLQLEGSRRMDTAEFLRGHAIAAGSILNKN